MARYDRTTKGTRNLDHSRISAGGTMSHAEIERRLLAGGAGGPTRYDFVVTGPLFIGDSVTPSFLIPITSSIGNIWMTVGRLPSGANSADSQIAVSVVNSGVVLASLTIDQDTLTKKSAVVDGAALGTLVKDTYVDINISHVGAIVPGSDLTVYIEIGQ